MSISSMSRQRANSSSGAQPSSPVENLSIKKDFSSYLSRHRREPIGQGYYSDVYRYIAMETYDTVEEGKLYAVKSIRQAIWKNIDKVKKRLYREINTWTPLEHPNILKLHGAIFAHELNSAQLPCLVSDLMPNGNAAEYFQDAPPSRLIPFLLGIARGISYLHSKGIAHGDLKADNVLVSANGDACVCDFGLSRCLNPGLDGPIIPSSSDGNSATRWTALEYVDFENGPKAPTTKGDVWSFGCTALQLLSGMPPFFDARSDPQIVMRLYEGHLPQFPPALEREDFEPYRQGIFALTRLCWIKDRVKRPSIDAVVSFLESYFPEDQGFEPPDVYGISRQADSPQPAEQNTVLEDVIEPERQFGLGNSSRTSTMETVTGASAVDLPPSSPSGSTSSSEGQGTRRRSSSSISEASILAEGSKSSETSAEPEADPRPKSWRTVPRPPAPSVENMLRHSNKSPMSVLNELQQGSGEMPAYEESSDGPSHVPRHLCVVMIGGREYGREDGLGKKKEIKQKAALRAVEQLRQEDPTRFSELKYWPLLLSHMRKVGREVAANISDEPEYNTDTGAVIYRVTISLDGATLSKGSGETRDAAREDAARNAYNVWDEQTGGA